MKLILLPLFFFFSIGSTAQFGFALETNLTAFNDDDLSLVNGLGLGFGLVFKEYIHEKGDFLAEVSYTLHRVKLQGYETFDPTQTADVKFSVDNINVMFLYSHYIVKNEEGFFIGPQAGSLLSFSNQWKPEKNFDNSNYSYEPLGYTNLDFTDIKPFNAGIIAGVSVGYDWFRVNVRYNVMLTNTLRGFTALDQDQPREPDLKQNHISISFNYLFQ